MNYNIFIYLFIFLLPWSFLISKEISFVDMMKERQSLSNWEHYFYHGNLGQFSGKKVLADKFIKTNVPFGFPLNYVILANGKHSEEQRLDSSIIEKRNYCQNHFLSEFQWLEIYLMIPFELDQKKTLDQCVAISQKTNDKELFDRLRINIRKELLVYIWDPIYNLDSGLLPQGIDQEILGIVKDFAYLDAIILTMLPRRVRDFKKVDLQRLQRKQMSFYHSPIKSEWLSNHQYLVTSKLDLITNPILRLLESIPGEEWDDLPEDRSNTRIQRWIKMSSMARDSKLMPQESKNVYESVEKCLNSWSYLQKRYLRLDIIDGQLEEENALLEMEEKTRHLSDVEENKFWVNMIGKMQSSRWQFEKRKRVEAICKASLRNEETWESILVPEFQRSNIK
jgi:hypothetical protein